jgi:multiple sugar transport system permease protein
MLNAVQERPARAAARRPKPRRRPGLFTRMRRSWWIYLFLLPTVVGYGLYTVYPLVASWWYAFLDWPSFADKGTFIGFDNFRRLVHDPLFWNAFKHSLLFIAIGVPLRVGLGLLIAIVLNQKATRFKGLFRTLIFLPVVATGAILGVVFTLILDANGPINRALVDLHLISHPISFLANVHTSLYTGIGVWVWKWLGITMVYWLAALQTIPRSLYESAQLDGASAWQEFRYITLPGLKFFLIIITLIDTVAAFNVFDLLQTLTAGGPVYSSEVIEIFVYRTAFHATVPELGYASAAAVIFGLTTLAFAAVQAIGIRAARKGMAAA